MVPHWPPPYGLDADPIQQLIIDDELTPGRRAAARQPDRHRLRRADDPPRRHRRAEASGTCRRCSRRGHLVPAVQRARRRLRPGQPRRRGRCATATCTWSTGRRSGRRWPTVAKFGILIARTDPDVAKHRGISYFICPMDLPGIEHAPDRRHDRRAHSFNEVFFTDVRVPAENLIGEENDGWRLAKVTLAQRAGVAVERRRRCGGVGPTVGDLLALVRAGGGATAPIDPASGWPGCPPPRPSSAPDAAADRLGPGGRQGARARGVGAEADGRRARSAGHGAGQGPGRRPRDAGRVGPGRRPAGVARGPTEINFSPDLAPGVDPVWHYGFCFSPALTIGGGTWAVQRNIVAEFVLGLPAPTRTCAARA